MEHANFLRGGAFRTVVDVGANRGQFALAVREFLPEARLISFEPLSEAARIFSEVFRNDNQVTLHRAAIGPGDRFVPLHVSKQDDSSSLLLMTPQQHRIFPGTQLIDVGMVHMAPLSNFVDRSLLSPPALLKIDVQGFELEALRGCETMLPLFACAYVECSFLELYKEQALAAEIIAWLAARDFELSHIYNPVLVNGEIVQADFVFSARARHSGR